MAQEIKVLSDREHILKRPNVYIGSIREITENRYIVKNGKYVKEEVVYIPGLVKIFEEIIDNSVDAFIKNGFKGSPKIDVILEQDYFSVEDNGTGIPNKKIDGLYMCEIAWGMARAGSNFDGDRSGIGTNGLGSYLTNVFSTQFIGINRNNGIEVTCEWTDNAKNKRPIKEKKLKKTGVKVIAYPDFRKFGVRGFRKNEIEVIKTRIYMLAETYPEIKFTFNGETFQEVEF